MAKNIYSYLSDVLIRSGIYPRKSTKLRKIEGLIKRLRPIGTNHNLIRVGDNKDGGYLIPNDLIGVNKCYSAGVGDTWEFEQQLYDLGIAIDIADKRIPSKLRNNSNLNLTEKYIGPEVSPDHISINKWIDIENSDEIILQLDIEGAEYESLIEINPLHLIRSRIIVIEFHRLQMLWLPDFYKMAKIAFDKVLKNHSCVHIHPNNSKSIFLANGIPIPMTAEFTFLRNDRIDSVFDRSDFPHLLDSDCTDNGPVLLPKYWYDQ